MPYTRKGYPSCMDGIRSSSGNSPISRSLHTRNYFKNGWSPIFGLETKKYRRLSLIRHVGLNIGANSKGQRRKLDRKAIWKTLYRFFNLDSPSEALGFPILKALRFDFVDWRLGKSDTDSIRVKIIEEIVQELRVSGGLAQLMIVGMQQEDSLFDLKQGLPKAGGCFQVFKERAGAYVEVSEELSVRLY